MDDIFLKASSLEEGQNLFNGTNTALTWSRFFLKAAKSRCLVMVNGKVQLDMFPSIESSKTVERIPSIVDNPVRFFWEDQFPSHLMIVIGLVLSLQLFPKVFLLLISPVEGSKKHWTPTSERLC